MDGDAIIITGGLLDDIHAKTTHGLIRGTDRYNIVGVIDEHYGGKDAGEILDGVNRDIPVFTTIDQFVGSGKTAQYCIIGVATVGGVIPPQMRMIIRQAMEEGFSIVNGLHEFLCDIDEFVQLANDNNVKLIDIRKPRPAGELKFWSGEIYSVKCPIIAVLGTDCALGKRTTAMMLVSALRSQGLNAEPVYTGQTGWMQGIRHGFIFDSTVNDFIGGEVERALVDCYRDLNPEMILIEGQSGLRNPSGPCGSEFLLSGNAKAVILQHDPMRKKYDGLEDMDIDMPSIKSEIELIKYYGSKTLAVTINTSQMDEKESFLVKEEYEKMLGIPVAIPMYEGVDSLAPMLIEYAAQYKKEIDDH